MSRRRDFEDGRRWRGGEGMEEGGRRRGGGGRRSGRGGSFGTITVTDAVRIGVNLALNKFRNDENETELEFPSSFTSIERAYVHKMAIELGLKSKSRGQGQNRYLTAFKKDESTIVSKDAILTLVQDSITLISDLLLKYPISMRERAELLPIIERTLTGREGIQATRRTGRLGSGIPMIPVKFGGKEYLQRRKELPIWAQRQEIIETIRDNQVILITGDTGSGKTTQVPQFLLEDAFTQQRPVRVVVCEPRRLAVTTVSERVAQERDEVLGQTVGYQIRLDACTSEQNLLTFCTYGVLLRSLMGGDQVSSNFTHVVIDEVHERDKLSDFLLTVLRDILEKNLNLKLILMSATVDTRQFLNYFPNCVWVSVPGRMYPVEEYHLEDVLLAVQYNNSGGKKPKYSGVKPTLRNEPSTAPAHQPPAVEADDDVLIEEDGSEVKYVDSNLDGLLSSGFLDGNQESIDLLYSILESDISVMNYQHSEKGVTILMVAAAWGAKDLLEFLLELGTNIHITAPNGWTALDFAKNTNREESIKLLEQHIHLHQDIVDEPESSTVTKLTEEQRQVLEVYQNSFDDDEVDHGLIAELLVHIDQQDLGAVLVFLPGYEDIVSIKEMLQQDNRAKNLLVLTLHSQMASSEHKKAFEPTRPGFRKVILSTNIAETGITLNDVIYVIDSGKVKEKSFDALTNSTMLKSDWISQSSATQRKGRAGRCQPGKVYRLFSSIRYSHLASYQTPEILRTPLLELCLQSKLLAPPNTPIADFLAKVPEPPAFLVTRNAVQSLKTLEALDQWEEVTVLGSHLLDIPLDPVYGKILLHGVVMRCLDPILTICCSLSYRDPFLLPSDSRGKKTADIMKKRLAGNTFSDHYALLNAFKEWDLARSKGQERGWSLKNNISNSTMLMIDGMKAQVLNHLKQSRFIPSSGGTGRYNSNSGNWSVVKSCIVAGLYPNLARYDRDARQLRTSRESKVKIHPGSVCSDLNKQIKTRGLPSDWLIFTEMTRVGRNTYIRGVSFITPACVGLLCGPSRLPAGVWETGERTGQVNQFIEETSDSEEEDHNLQDSIIINLDPWVSLRTTSPYAQRLLQLRQKWTLLWQRTLSHKYDAAQEIVDNIVVATVGEVLQLEDQQHGLISQQPYRNRLAETLSKVHLNDAEPRLQDIPHPSRVPDIPPTMLRPPPNLPTTYYLVRPSPGSLNALESAMSHGNTAVWSFSPAVERRILVSIQQGRSVIVLFNVTGTHQIQGSAAVFGQRVSEGNRVGQRIEWLSRQPLDLNNLGPLLTTPELQQWKDITEIPADAARPFLTQPNPMVPGAGRGARRGKYIRRN